MQKYIDDQKWLDMVRDLGRLQDEFHEAMSQSFYEIYFEEDSTE